MGELPIVERLRERSLELQSTAWSRMDGGQECSLSATLVDETADTIAALYEALLRWSNIMAQSGVWPVKDANDPMQDALAQTHAALSLALGEKQ